jgi:F-type H+-transporting ATPase subunit b
LPLLIDWFTVLAQIVNFLILVFLLHRFLYNPILNAMARREQRIADDLETAERKRREAREEIESYRQKKAELEERRQEFLSQAEEDAEEKRRQLLQKARAETDEIRTRWQRAIEQEKESFLADLRRRVSQETYRVIRSALADMADVALEERIVTVFLARLAELPQSEREALGAGPAATETADSWKINSAFDLPDERQEEIRQVVEEVVGYNGRLTFNTQPDLIAGIELVAAGHKVAWSLDSYLDNLEEALSDLLTQAKIEEVAASDEEE